MVPEFQSLIFQSAAGNPDEYIVPAFYYRWCSPPDVYHLPDMEIHCGLKGCGMVGGCHQPAHDEMLLTVHAACWDVIRKGWR